MPVRPLTLAPCILCAGPGAIPEGARRCRGCAASRRRRGLVDSKLSSKREMGYQSSLRVHGPCRTTRGRTMTPRQCRAGVFAAHGSPSRITIRSQRALGAYLDTRGRAFAHAAPLHSVSPAAAFDTRQLHRSCADTRNSSNCRAAHRQGPLRRRSRRGSSSCIPLAMGGMGAQVGVAVSLLSLSEHRASGEAD